MSNKITLIYKFLELVISLFIMSLHLRSIQSYIRKCPDSIETYERAMIVIVV